MTERNPSGLAAEGYRQARLHALGDVLREQRRSRPLLTAAVDGEVRLRWPELDARVNRLAALLRARGIGAGGRVLWLGQNSFRLFETLLAAAKLGAVFCPANWRLSAAEFAGILADFDPGVVIWQAEEIGATVAQAQVLDAAAKRCWIRHDGDGDDDYEARLAAFPDTDDDRPVDPEAPLLAIFTAAFDGRPNAALLSHAAIFQQALVTAYGESVNERSVFLNSGPLFHIGTFMTTFALLLFGGCNVFVARSDADTLLALIERERATHAFIPPPTIEQIRRLNADGRYDVSSLWPSHDAKEWRNTRVMPLDAPYLQCPSGYGQTETMGLAVLGWLGGEGAGRPAPGVQVRIVDDNGREVPAGEVGEIVMRGGQLMSGYFGRAEENAQRVRDGWHHTRDLGLRREDGSIVFVGPKIALIKSALENIYPAEVEACLRQHPAVKDACVIGVPDPTWTQSVKAVVELHAGASATGAELIEHCRSRMASYKKPKHVEFIAALPRTAVGFVDRAAVDAGHGGGGYPTAG